MERKYKEGDIVYVKAVDKKAALRISTTWHYDFVFLAKGIHRAIYDKESRSSYSLEFSKIDGGAWHYPKEYIKIVDRSLNNQGVLGIL